MVVSLFCVFQSFSCLLFSFSCSLWDTLRFRDSFLSVSSLLISLSQHFSFPLQYFWSLEFLFGSYFKISITLLTLPVCSCILSALSMSTLSILTVVSLNSWTDNTISCHIWVWFWHLFCLLKFYFLPFGMSLFFFSHNWTWGIEKRNPALLSKVISTPRFLLW